MSWRGGSPARDTVEALTFLTAPGHVTVTVGSTSYLCAVKAGIDTCTVPLGLGTVSATIRRGGVPTASADHAAPGHRHGRTSRTCSTSPPAAAAPPARRSP